MKKPLGRKLDPIKIFQHATNFQESDHALRKAFPAHDPKIMLIAQPSMVLSAFASELYIKCLLCIENGKVPNEHNLKTLFLQLAPSTRRRIEELWNDDIKQPHRQETFNRIRAIPGAENLQLDLLYALKISGDAFIDLRYFYETQKAFFILDAFPNMLRTVILENCPHWTVTPATLAIGPIR